MKPVTTHAVTDTSVAPSLPSLSTVGNLPSCIPLAGYTANAVRQQIFYAEDRFDSKGRRIPGNGLAASGAIVRRGRKVLIDVQKYVAWLATGNTGGAV